jgi:2-polyprenyl-3-methyl-5-hydroxy-6-metoxy-1,4-benzoquinol methylase
MLGRSKLCPSCGGQVSTKVDSKFFVTSLNRCLRCGLLFRIPTTTEAESEVFYQSEYSQGFTTDIPTAADLQRLVNAKFIGSKKDFTNYIGIIGAFGVEPGSKLLDYGCSWGYGSWQLQEAGYTVKAYEISRPRCQYAQDKLGIDAHSSLEAIKGPFDLFFSAHVLEHLPCPRKVFDFSFKVLKPDGLFIAFTPNGSREFRQRNYRVWHQLWGLVHPNLLDIIYFDEQFKRSPRLFATSPYDMDSFKTIDFRDGNRFCFDLSGPELLFVARKKNHSRGWN